MGGREMTRERPGTELSEGSSLAPDCRRELTGPDRRPMGRRIKKEKRKVDDGGKAKPERAYGPNWGPKSQTPKTKPDPKRSTPNQLALKEHYKPKRQKARTGARGSWCDGPIS